jgi:DMSO reductase iron-sulfur subunit
MTQLGFYFDAKRCTGCRACVLACKDYKNLPEEYSFRSVYEYGAGDWTQGEDGTWTTDAFVYYVSASCNHCDNPACVAACPVGSMTKHEENGLVYNDPATCIGCGACVEACPYGAPTLDTRAQRSIKCDMCADRLSEGMAPICVEACPMRALEVGDIEDLRAKYGDTAAIAPLPDPDQTGPNYVLTEPEGAQPCGSDAGQTMNVREIA